MFQLKLFNIVSIYIALNNEILNCDNKIENILQVNTSGIEIQFSKYGPHHVSK